MVVMVVKSHLLDYKEFHQWLNAFDPGWTWKLPIRKGTATTVSKGDSKDVSGLEWSIENEVRDGAFISDLVGDFRIHYKFSTRERAMIAKLRWGNMKPYRMGTSA